MRLGDFTNSIIDSADDAADAAAVAEAQSRLADSVRAVCAVTDMNIARICHNAVGERVAMVEADGGIALDNHAASSSQTPLESLVALCDELVGVPSPVEADRALPPGGSLSTHW